MMSTSKILMGLVYSTVFIGVGLYVIYLNRELNNTRSMLKIADKYAIMYGQEVSRLRPALEKCMRND